MEFERYARQIIEIFSRKTGCDYKFSDGSKKGLVVMFPAEPILRLKGESWNAIAYQLNGIMNTAEFNRKYRIKDPWSEIWSEYLK